MLVWTPKAYLLRRLQHPQGAARRRARATRADPAHRSRVVHPARRFSATPAHHRPLSAGHAVLRRSPGAPGPTIPRRRARSCEQAGVKSLKLTFLLTAGSRTVEQLATLLKEDFARAGIELEVATVDFAVQLDRLRHHAFDVSALQWTMQLEQDNYPLFHSSQAERGAELRRLSQRRGRRAPRPDPPDRRRRPSATSSTPPCTSASTTISPTPFWPRPRCRPWRRRACTACRPSTDGFNFAEAWVRQSSRRGGSSSCR